MSAAHLARHLASVLREKVIVGRAALHDPARRSPPDACCARTGAPQAGRAHVRQQQQQPRDAAAAARDVCPAVALRPAGRRRRAAGRPHAAVARCAARRREPVWRLPASGPAAARCPGAAAGRVWRTAAAGAAPGRQARAARRTLGQPRAWRGARRPVGRPAGADRRVRDGHGWRTGRMVAGACALLQRLWWLRALALCGMQGAGM